MSGTLAAGDHDDELLECPACEEPQALKGGRFVEHHRAVVQNGKVLRGMPCPGRGRTWEEASQLKQEEGHQ